MGVSVFSCASASLISSTPPTVPTRLSDSMVLFKRKPVQLVTVPVVEDESQEVWWIEQTGEVFLGYEDYLDRLDFYIQPRFICAVTGKSGLTFFQALESEQNGATEVEQNFPEPLKAPVLRRVQFQTISRIDNLVDLVYDEYKAEYFPGETVVVRPTDKDSIHEGVVRDKMHYGSKVNPDGSLTKPYSRYFVKVPDMEQEVGVSDSRIFRDKKVFTKSIIRSFIKKSVIRESWNGAPWLVKHDVAAKYNIDTRVPAHLHYDSKLLERKHLQAQKRLSQTSEGTSPVAANGPAKLPELKPAPKSHKSKAQQALLAQQRAGLVAVNPGLITHMSIPGNPFQQPPHSMRNQPIPPLILAQAQLPPSPPPPKYPIEDLQVQPRMNGSVRPRLNYACSDAPVPSAVESVIGDKILMKSVGPLLETWNSLNVYCEVFRLDSFTFDDYVETLLVASEEMPVQLFDEIHCAVLKILVSSQEDGGRVQIQLPEMPADGEDEDGEVESAAPTPEPEPEPNKRATRSSIAKLEAERLAAEAAAAEKEAMDLEWAPKHKADEVLKNYDWIEHLRDRDFRDGGWELIMVGLLRQLSKDGRQKAKCEELLQELVPMNVEATRETVRQHYARLDANLRVQALQIVCMLTAQTKAARAYMEDCSEQMTAYRKDKIEWQRKRKQAIEDLKALNEERKMLLPDNMPPSPSLDPPTRQANGNVSMHVSGLASEEEVPDAEDNEDGQKLRRGKIRATERKRKAVEKELRDKERAEAAAKQHKQSKAFIKVTKEIAKREQEIREAEKEIAVIDNDLREADCPRTRVLGKDRFWNRYWWFERNGMPYGGLPNSSTAYAGYANGCLWVQGPDDLERQGYIDMPTEWQNEYRAKFNMTVPERRKMEEGATSVLNSWQWGYYSEPADVDALLDWLDTRGVNEMKLRKEIVNFRDKMQHHMEMRKRYLEPKGALTEPAKEEAEASGSNGTTKRMSTRGKAHATQASLEPPPYRCLAWTNSMYLEETGRLHSEGTPKPVLASSAARSRKPTNKKKEAEPVVCAAPSPETPTMRAHRTRKSRG